MARSILRSKPLYNASAGGEMLLKSLGQSDPADQPSEVSAFLSGGGEMGALMRRHDWAATSLGPPSAWPQSLRTVLRLMLTTNHPMFVFWGPEHLCFYNDAYRQSIGPEKHPAMLGARGREMWNEVWPIIGPQIDMVMAGRGATWHENQLVPIIRHGGLADVYWTYSFSPIDDADSPNRVGGVLVVCTETTEQVLAERRQSFLLRLGDRLGALADVQNIEQTAAGMLGEELGADRVVYAAIDAPASKASVRHEWTKAGGASLLGDHQLADFGPDMLQAVTSGAPIAVSDIGTDPKTRLHRETFEALDIHALVIAPLIRDGALINSLSVHSFEPRRWSERDITLVREVAERTWDAVERARAEAALAASEARLRQVMEAGRLATFDVDDPASGEGATVSRGFRELWGLPPSACCDFETILACVHSEDREGFVADHARLAAEGGSFQTEFRIVLPDGAIRWLEARGQGDRDRGDMPRRIRGVNLEITERKEAEETQRLLIDELNHRVRNTLAIIASIANQTHRHSDSLEAFSEAFEGRIQALAATHTLLSDQKWGVSALKTIIDRQLEPYSQHDEAVIAAGPPVLLKPKPALALSLVFHELATNAAKHGALATGSGRIDIRWETVERSDGPVLRLRWTESGGPPVDPPSHEGFGSKLVDINVEHEFRGDVERDYRPEGLVCTLRLPLSKDVTSTGRREGTHDD